MPYKLSDAQLEAVTMMKRALKSSKATFACGGTIEDIKVNQLLLFNSPATAQSEQSVVWVEIVLVKRNRADGLRMTKLPLSVETARALYDNGVPSPHGMGGELVLDETYRQAHELKVTLSPTHKALVS